MVSFTDIQDAFFFVSSAGYGMHSAVLNKDAGLDVISHLRTMVLPQGHGTAVGIGEGNL